MTEETKIVELEPKEIASLMSFKNSNLVAEELVKHSYETAKALYYELLWQLGKAESSTQASR